MNGMITGSVFNIERYSVHDGPGIRTLVFLKGCLLSCLWCCNPESQQAKPELLLFPENCIGCGACVDACPVGAVTLREGKIVTDAAKCTLCMRCVDECYPEARRAYGRPMSVDEVIKKIEGDIPFYERSGGGVTVSGGEPFVQHKFLKELFQACRSRGIGTAVETCGYVPEDVFSAMMPYVDVYLFDLKHMDSAHHRELTGKDNQLIHRNFQAVVAAGKHVIPRMPLIPTLNDSWENLRETCAFLRKNGLDTLNILPYHELGVNKYARLGRTYELHLQPHTKEQLAEIQKFVVEQGICCLVH
jgi:pyruvate formate lyase activating enzyme